MNPGPVSSRISRLITHEAKLCRRFTQYLHIDDKSDEINIFMGVGFISGRDGLSQGLPIDILNMIIVADQVRKKLAPVKSKIHLLIADHMAYHNLTDEVLLGAKALAKSYEDQILALLRSLGIQDQVTLHMSSQVVLDKRYQDILHALGSQGSKSLSVSDDKLAVDVFSCQGKYNSSHLFYFLNQTALMEYFFSVHGCQIKIGWSKGSTHKAILGTDQYDEPHFDRFYQQVYGSAKVSFIYVDAGHNVENDASEVPYCAPNKGSRHARILFGSDATILIIHPKSPLGKNIDLYYEYLRRDNSDKDCSVSDKLSIILALTQQKPRETLILLQEAFENLTIESDLEFRPSLTPGYRVLRMQDTSLSMQANVAPKKPKKSGMSVLL